MQGDSPAYQDFSAIGNTANGGGSGYPARNNIANRSENNVTFDPLSKSDPVHGDPTMGLGSSTFWKELQLLKLLLKLLLLNKRLKLMSLEKVAG